MQKMFLIKSFKKLLVTSFKTLITFEFVKKPTNIVQHKTSLKFISGLTKEWSKRLASLNNVELCVAFTAAEVVKIM